MNVESKSFLAGSLRYGCLIVFVAVLCQGVRSQVQHVEMTADNGNVRFSLPEKYLVHRESYRTRIFGRLPDGEVTFTIEESPSAARYVKNMPKFRTGDKDVEREDGKTFYIRRYETASADRYYAAIYYGSGDKLVTFVALGDSAAALLLRQFMSRIAIAPSERFGGNRLGTSAAGPRTDISTLSTSPEISAALSRPDVPESSVSFGTVKERTDDNRRFSNRLLLVKTQPARYTDKARTNGIQGLVRVRVGFLANGEIRSIVVDPSLSWGLPEHAALAARSIKFLPAKWTESP